MHQKYARITNLLELIKKADAGKLLDYTKKIDKEILTRKIGFLLDLANIRHDLKINTKTIYKFNSGVKQKGKFNNKWRLYVNEEFV